MLVQSAFEEKDLFRRICFLTKKDLLRKDAPPPGVFKCLARLVTTAHLLQSR